jgi:hypothetical protein
MSVPEVLVGSLEVQMSVPEVLVGSLEVLVGSLEV